MLARRSLLAGLFVAPAIIRTPGLLMSISSKRLVLPDMYGLVHVEGTTYRATRPVLLTEWQGRALRPQALLRGDCIVFNQ